MSASSGQIEIDVVIESLDVVDPHREGGTGYRVKVSVNGSRVLKIRQRDFPHPDAAAAGPHPSFTIDAPIRSLESTEISFAVFRSSPFGVERRVGWTVIDAASVVTGAARLQLPLRPPSTWPRWILTPRRRALNATERFARRRDGASPVDPDAVQLTATLRCVDISRRLVAGTRSVRFHTTDPKRRIDSVRWVMKDSKGAEVARSPEVIDSDAMRSGRTLRGAECFDFAPAARGEGDNENGGVDGGNGGGCRVSGGPHSLAALCDVPGLSVVVEAELSPRTRSTGQDQQAPLRLSSLPIPLRHLLPRIDPYLDPAAVQVGQEVSHILMRPSAIIKAAVADEAISNHQSSRVPSPVATVSLTLWFTGLPRFAQLAGGLACSDAHENALVTETIDAGGSCLGALHRRDGRAHVYGAVVSRACPILAGRSFWSLFRGDMSLAASTRQLNFVHVRESCSDAMLRFNVNGPESGLLHAYVPRGDESRDRGEWQARAAQIAEVTTASRKGRGNGDGDRHHKRNKRNKGGNAARRASRSASMSSDLSSASLSSSYSSSSGTSGGSSGSSSSASNSGQSDASSATSSSIAAPGSTVQTSVPGGGDRWAPWRAPVWERLRVFASNVSLFGTEGHTAAPTSSPNVFITFGGGHLRARTWLGNGGDETPSSSRFSNEIMEFKFDRLNSESAIEIRSVPAASGSPVPHGRTGHTFTAIGGDRFILFGGTGGEQGGRGANRSRGRRFNDLWVYSHRTRTWEEAETTGPSPPPRARHAAVLVGRKLYIVGGRSTYHWLGGTYFDDLHCLDTRTWRWTRLARPSSNGGPITARAGHSCHAVGGHSFVAFGGFVDPGLRNDLFCYDARRAEWREIVPPVGEDGSPPPRESHASLFIPNTSSSSSSSSSWGLLVVMLGEGEGGGVRCVWAIDLPHGGWFRCADQGYGPSGRAGASLMNVGGSAVVYGGDTGWNMSREAFVLRPALGGSSPIAAAAVSRKGPKIHTIQRGPMPASVVLESGPCCVCLNRRVGAVLVPCGHAALCGKCAVRMLGCPLCRSHIEAVHALGGGGKKKTNKNKAVGNGRNKQE